MLIITQHMFQCQSPRPRGPHFASAGGATKAANNRNDEKGSAGHDGARLQREAEHYDEAAERRRRARPRGGRVKDAFVRGVKPGAPANSS